MIYLLPAIPYALHVVGIDEQESEGNCCDDDDGSHSVCLFQEQVLLSDVSSIGYSALNVNPILEQFQNFWKVFCVP